MNWVQLSHWMLQEPFYCKGKDFLKEKSYKIFDIYEQV